MNTALKVGLTFQAVQFSLVIGAVLVALLMQLSITGVGVMIFMWICLNIASLALMVIGAMKEKRSPDTRYRSEFRQRSPTN